MRLAYPGIDIRIMGGITEYQRHGYHKIERGIDLETPSDQKPTHFDFLGRLVFFENEPCNQETAQHEKQIHADVSNLKKQG